MSNIIGGYMNDRKHKFTDGHGHPISSEIRYGRSVRYSFGVPYVMLLVRINGHWHYGRYYFRSYDWVALRPYSREHYRNQHWYTVSTPPYAPRTINSVLESHRALLGING